MIHNAAGMSASCRGCVMTPQRLRAQTAAPPAPDQETSRGQVE
ncbi:hypothetical protein [Kibdelosporangium philippinense]